MNTNERENEGLQIKDRGLWIEEGTASLTQGHVTKKT